MKRITILITLVILLLNIWSGVIYAAPEKPPLPEENSSSNTQETDVNDSNWISKALSAAKNFLLGEIDTSTSTGENVNKVLVTARQIIRGINNVLLVLLGGLSAVSLSVVGIRYIASGALPEQKRVAIESLHTVFKGMAIGFGAFLIWRIAMGFVNIIFNSF